jgi:acetyl-CoA carboxylase biotin carboxyl carrier protein
MPGRGAPGPDHRALAELVRQLGALLTELDLVELEASVGDLRVRLHRRPPSGATPGPATAGAPAVALPAPVAEASTAAGLVTVEAPMVGTFYRAPSPGADPYVQEGDVVKEGQILGLIEAMKLMNEIEARVAGRVVKILVENGHPVEFGQPLFLLQPLG